MISRRELNFIKLVREKITRGGKMSRHCVDLLFFALVAVCVCAASGALDRTAEGNTTVSTPPSASTHQTDKDSYTRTTAAPDTSPPPSAPPPSNRSTHNSSHELDENNTHNSPKSTESNVTESTTMGSTTPAPTAHAAASTTPGSTSQKSTTQGSYTGTQSDNMGKGAGIFFLILILLIILVLATILYILWKKGKRYSFDLTVNEHETPLQTIDTGVFEQSKGSTANLDYIQEDKSNHVANGCTGETPESTPGSDQQNVPEEDSSLSDLCLGSPIKKVEFNLDLELIGVDSDVVKQATDNETTDNDNENNNNDINTGNDAADLFTEINLDDTQ